MEFRFKKKYGQKFLIDKNIIKKIANIPENKVKALVIEIGCGDGRLTKELCFLYDNVLGYEIDKDLEPHLKENLKNFDNYKIIFNDFLKEDIKKSIDEYDYENLYIIANLPYYITTPIIEKIIDSNINPNMIVIMVQKEVGDRFTAKIGTKEYNSLTVHLNYYFDIKKEFVVKRNNFIPKPNVDSIVVSFSRKKEQLKVKDKDLFNRVVKDSFQYKRKTLRNNLKNYDLNKIEEVLKKYDYDLSIRAENLSLKVFVDIVNNL